MHLYRLAPEGFYALDAGSGEVRLLHSDPFDHPSERWELGRSLDLAGSIALAPVIPGKVVGVGRNFARHAAELGNPTPEEPLLFLKSPSSVIGPGVPVVLPPESVQVDFEGEIAVVLRRQLRRAGREEACEAVLGVTCACDVTARDLQRRDSSFARAKSFDTFCPLGPAVNLEPPLDDLELTTRVNGDIRQRAHASEMIWGIVELLTYISRVMTLEPGDVVLTGTPAGVGALSDGDRVEVEVSGVGTLSNPVEAWRQR